MAKPTAESIAAGLTVPERILLFCLASDTDWQAASITHATAQHTMVRGLIERDHAATRYALTNQERAVLGGVACPEVSGDGTARSVLGAKRKSNAHSEHFGF